MLLIKKDVLKSAHCQPNGKLVMKKKKHLKSIFFFCTTKDAN